MTARFFIFLSIAVAAGVLSSFFLPTVLGYEDSSIKGQLSAGFAIAICILQAGALWYFLSSLKTFSRDLKTGYYLLSAGLLIFSLLQLQLPVALFLKLEILQIIFVLAPFLVGPLVMYLGVRRFARLLHVHSRFTSIWLAIVVALFTSAVPTLISLVIFQETTTYVYGILMWGGGFALVAGILALRIRNALNPAYNVAMRRLGIALCALFVGCLHEVIARDTLAFFESTTWYSETNASVWPFLVVAALILWAGLSFRAVHDQYGALSTSVDGLDVVVHAAQLVTLPSEIDKIVDKIRVLTASRSSSQFTAEDESTIVGVYLELEDYLVNKERLRTFSRVDLRAMLPAKFQQSLPATSPA